MRNNIVLAAAITLITLTTLGMEKLHLTAVELQLPDVIVTQIAGDVPSNEKNLFRSVCKQFQQCASINNLDIYLERYKQYGLLLSIYKDTPFFTGHLLLHGADPDKTEEILERSPTAQKQKNDWQNNIV